MPTIKLTEPQGKFVFSEARFPALIGGLGSGKSQAGTYRIAKLMLEEPGCNCAYYFPTYDLIKLRGMPGLCSDLNNLGVKFTVNISDHSVILDGYGSVIFRSYDRPERVVAYEVAHSVVDELDTLPKEKAEFVWRKVVERNRQKTNHKSGNTIGCVTTPDMGQLGFVFEKWGGVELQDGYELIKASTYSNPFLPPDYIDNIKKNYNSDQIDLYLNGEFVSLKHRPVFDRKATEKALLECYKPSYRAVLEGKKFVKRDGGELRVWAEPKSGKRYVIGADVAEGLATGDFSCADVLEMPGGEQVAQWHGHIAPDLFGNVLANLGKWYNSALIGVECNNHGILTNTTLRDLYYPFLYVQKSVDNAWSDEKQTSRIGWTTNRRTKPYIIDQLAAEIREGTHGIYCKETIDEMKTYIVEDNGSYNAQSGCFDDRVMARAIAGEMMRYSRTN